ncbi:ccr4-not transcription subunit 3 [Grosmannia clavigera kw1407]|uniref:General negative regulator of transcription subunit n=1 Tax=Grosmannia clavigera (strain kw1407 / UAMH 11150) TaxID=655863 RepID=F0XDU8_GROCL|nr:ccr4-not transcription subunit 3 [Grosmannia clavigera kw1407]EFX04210.1 ccr4-not transcription subunit 3 [Grosmannia clavigera kw1407]
MAARKLQQEVDKCFKKVTEGVSEFDAIYEKIEQSNNPAQKEKLEDNLKREIKKLQRLRDQIKTWAAGNEIKDKGPLMEQRRLIETQMERFKAVEKAMKTKAYSKEGLSAATKLDPKEQAKVETGEFLSSQVDELEQQIESLEAEGEAIQATVKRGKIHGAKAERMAEIERIIERHKWHQGKLERLRRSLENGAIDIEQVNDLEESIRYYVTDNQNDDFMEDDTMYDDLNLDEEEEGFGLNGDDRVSSQDTQSIQGDLGDLDVKPPGTSSGKGRATTDSASISSSGRRPSAQLKSPLPTLATLHTPLQTLSNGISTAVAMKPASIPARPAGEGLKYASAAAAAAASDRLNVGIAPLPPPPGVVGPSQQTQLPAAIAPSLPAAQASRAIASAANSPKPPSAQPHQHHQQQAEKVVPPSAAGAASGVASGSTVKPENARSAKARSAAASTSASTTSTPAPEPADAAGKGSHTNGTTNGVKTATPVTKEGEQAEEESIYHLPSSLQDLVESFEVTKSRPPQSNPTTGLRMLAQSVANAPETMDAEPPRRYHPEVRFHSSSNFPQEPLALLDDPRLYARIEPDTLFYVFYYKQGTYQQYLAAKALKDMSWRFHKQYQTWFQRHEEPKSITEEFEQGTYRFFDYESTWMNRRKADFKFVYKFLEDDNALPDLRVTTGRHPGCSAPFHHDEAVMRTMPKRLAYGPSEIDSLVYVQEDDLNVCSLLAFAFLASLTSAASYSGLKRTVNLQATRWKQGAAPALL